MLQSKFSALAMGLVVLGLAGCETLNPTISPPLGLPATTTLPAGTDLRVVDVVVSVPLSLTVSEINGRYPTGTDIVWRGEAFGDRHAQVTAIFDEAGNRAVAQDGGTQSVIADIAVTRFHGITPGTHAVGDGVYTMHFTISYRDARTGLPLGPARAVEADLVQPPESPSLVTDREPVIAHLAAFFAREFATPVGLGR